MYHTENAAAAYKKEGGAFTESTSVNYQAQRKG